MNDNSDAADRPVAALDVEAPSKQTAERDPGRHNASRVPAVSNRSASEHGLNSQGCHQRKQCYIRI
jgi:hypothetical protein